MKLWEIFRFEIRHQVRRASTWICTALLLLLTYYMTREIYIDNARNQGYLFNGPFVIATMAFLGSLMGLLIASSVTGDAAARDVQARMDPLLYTTPVSKAEHLGGRFLAAFSLVALVLCRRAARIAARGDRAGSGRGSARSTSSGRVSRCLPGPAAAERVRRNRVHVFAGDAQPARDRELPRWCAALRGVRVQQDLRGRNVGAVGAGEVAGSARPHRVERALDDLDASGEEHPPRLASRARSSGTAFCGSESPWRVLALTHVRFRLAHHAAGSWRRRGARPAEREGAPIPGATAQVAPTVQRTFGVATHLRQALAVARESLQTIVTSWGAMALASMAAALVVASGTQIEHMGVPLVATSARTVTLLSDRLTDPQEVMSLMVPLLVVFFAGELVWREREARLNEIADAAPVPDWVSALGKFVGLSLALVAVQALMMGAGLLIQGSRATTISSSLCTGAFFSGSSCRTTSSSPCSPLSSTCW